MGIKCLHAGTQHIVGLFDLVRGIQENVIASLHCANLTYPFCNCKIQRKTKKKKKKPEMMSLCHVPRFAVMHCSLLFAGAPSVADTLEAFPVSLYDF